jgi:ferredoxin-NADP reductase
VTENGPPPAPIDSSWRTATVEEVSHPTSHGASLRLLVPDHITHQPGQHYVVRLTAEDGYTAQRSYSVASAPSDPLIELYVEQLPDGEVSGFLTEVARPGDSFEVRGPIGGWFVWPGDRSALGIAGGSGVVPLVAMLRHAREVGRSDLLTLAVSARTLGDLPYLAELREDRATLVLSREVAPSGRPAGRLGPGDLAPLLAADQTIYVCGSAGFAEAASGALLRLEVDPTRVRVERFGPTG